MIACLLIPAIAPGGMAAVADGAIAIADLWPTLRVWLMGMVPLILVGLLLQLVLNGLQRRFRRPPVLPSSPSSPTQGLPDRPLASAQLIQPMALPPQSSSAPPDGPVEEAATPPLSSPTADADGEPAASTLEPGTILAGGMNADRITDPQGAIARPALLMRRKNYWEDHQQIYNHGLELVECNQLLEAIANFDRAIELQPDFALAWTAKGNALLKLGQPDAATPYFHQATELQGAAPPGEASPSISPPAVATPAPDSTEVTPGYTALYNQGMALYETQQFEEALSVLQQAIALQPHRPDALMGMGTVLERLGRLEEAQASFDRAAAFHPSR